MLNTLDTVIAFAVIMTVVSLLITILVQMVSAALSLRGKNLANALALTFQSIDPKIGEQAHALAEKILKDPILSDSLRTPKNRAQIPAALLPRHDLEAADKDLVKAEDFLAHAQVSTLAGAADIVRNAQDARDQAKAALDRALARFGPTVGQAWGILSTARQALATAAAKEQPVKGDEVDAALKALDDLLPPLPAREGFSSWTPWTCVSKTTAWGFWNLTGAMQLATAVRPGEVYRILHEIGDLTKTEAYASNLPADLIPVAANLLLAVGVPDGQTHEAREKLQSVATLADIFTTSEQRQVILNSVVNLGATVEQATTQTYDRFQRWFGSAQDRSEQWFQLHVRMVTIFFSIVAAFLLQLDTVEIFHQLRANPATVAELVKAAPVVGAQGAATLDPADTPAHATYLQWLHAHPLYRLKSLPDPPTLAGYHAALAVFLKNAAPDTEWPADQLHAAFARNNIPGDAYKEWVEDFPGYKLDPLPTDENKKITEQSLTDAIDARVKADAAVTKEPARWVAEYDALLPQGTQAFETARQASIGKLENTLANAGFDLVPAPFLRRWNIAPDTDVHWRDVFSFNRHFPGVLITAALLALGAPFWFNLLKNLMNLRPAVATLIERRPTSSPALPQSPPSAPAN